MPAASIDSLRERLPLSPVIRARIERLKAEVVRLDRQNPPVPMKQPGTGVTLGAVHYGEPAVLDLLRWMPYVTVGGVLLLLSLGLWALAGLRMAEKRTIWVGMARETAHQLGTPLSSLMGWVELLRAHAEAAPPGAAVPVPRAELEETLTEMERDVDRLNKVAQRFSHVGSAPHLQLQEVAPVVREAVQYVRRRLPHDESRVRAARALRGRAAHQPQPRADRVGAREPAGERDLGAGQDAGRDRGHGSSAARRPRRSRSWCRTTAAA